MCYKFRKLAAPELSPNSGSNASTATLSAPASLRLLDLLRAYAVQCEPSEGCNERVSNPNDWPVENSPEDVRNKVIM